MKFIYEYLYYKIYTFLYFVNKKNDIIEWSALLGHTLLVSLNILKIDSTLEVYFPNYHRIHSRIIAQIMCGLIMFVNYFIFIRKKIINAL